MRVSSKIWRQPNEEKWREKRKGCIKKEEMDEKKKIKNSKLTHTYAHDTAEDSEC